MRELNVIEQTWVSGAGVGEWVGKVIPDYPPYSAGKFMQEEGFSLANTLAISIFLHLGFREVVSVLFEAMGFAASSRTMNMRLLNVGIGAAIGYWGYRNGEGQQAV